MQKFWRRLLTACAFAQAALGISALPATDALAQSAGKPVPPPLHAARARYFKDHPTELAALIARLPIPHDNFGKVVNPPQAAPTFGGVWSPVATPMPGGGATAPHLMMDGTVLIHQQCSGIWHKLTPSSAGSYEAGTWSTIATMPVGYTPLYFAAQVLADGRLIMNGGEYNTGCNFAWTPLGAIYDPTTDTWQSVATPFTTGTIGDAQSAVLFNKDYMLADCCSTDAAILNPQTMKWRSTGTGKADDYDEEGWSLLPNGNLITGDAYVYAQASCGMNTEKYSASTGRWTSAGNSPVQLSDCSGASPTNEVGPQMLRPDGTVVMFSGMAIGSPAGTAVYNSATRTYAQGANIPAVNSVNYTLADAPAALEPNGSILFAASPGPAFAIPTHFFEYSPANTAARISNDPPNAASNSSYVYNLLVLPTGQILMTDFSNTIQLYNPVGAPKADWAPVLVTAPTTIRRGVGQAITGMQLNGLSEAGAYGDDVQAATDFPLVRITQSKTGQVFYCKTTNESSRDIAVKAVTTMDFECPASVPAGAASLVVVTNGIASLAKAVTIK